MTYAILFITGLLIGFTAGLLVYRKHIDKLKAAEGKGKSILDALKGK
jgi:F0F1-type ATP synthase assembly protein I